MDWLDRDARQAARALRRSPAFSIAALATLALGIGATTAAFSVVYGVLLRPLPFPAANRLVRIWEEHPGGTTVAGNRWLSAGAFQGWRRSAQTLDALGAYGNAEGVIRLRDVDTPIALARVSPSLLHILGAIPLHGRLLRDEDAEPAALRVALLSESVWRERFATDPSILGRAVRLDGEPTTIVGVLPDGFAFPTKNIGIWVPYVTSQIGGMTILGRLSAHATVEQVEAEAPPLPGRFRSQPSPGRCSAAVRPQWCSPGRSPLISQLPSRRHSSCCSSASPSCSSSPG